MITTPEPQADRSPDASSPFRCSDYAPNPYPGMRPDFSFVEIDDAAWVVRPHAECPSKWGVDVGVAGVMDLDEWLIRHGAASLTERLPLLAYGSNASPGKIEWLRSQGLTGPSVVVKADVEGVAAVWAAGIRVRDDQRPAVLAATPGVIEEHAVWFVTPEQRATFDNVEGRGERYRLAWLHAPLTLSNGTHVDWVLAYVARPMVAGHNVPVRLNRSPLLVDGKTVRMADVAQSEGSTLVGDGAESDGLEVVEVTGEPSWTDIEEIERQGGSG